MTQVDFYILNSSDTYSFSCKLTEKIYMQNLPIYIHCPTIESVALLNRRLWIERPSSYIPHDTINNDISEQPVLIGSVDNPEISIHHVLINLAINVPHFFSRFERVLEIVGHEEFEKKNGRERFRFYKERGYPLQTHNIG